MADHLVEMFPTHVKKDKGSDQQLTFLLPGKIFVYVNADEGRTKPIRWNNPSTRSFPANI